MKNTVRTLFISSVLSILAFDLSAQISGTVTINQLAPAAATNYTSFYQLPATLNKSGIEGPLAVDMLAN
jgi:hypothetical protein